MIVNVLLVSPFHVCHLPTSGGRSGQRLDGASRAPYQRPSSTRAAREHHTNGAGSERLSSEGDDR